MDHLSKKLKKYPMPKKMAIVKLIELLNELIYNWDEEVSFGPFIDSKSNSLPEVVSAGKSLEDIGGYDLMLSVCKSMPLEHMRGLEFAWAGIGGWQA